MTYSTFGDILRTLGELGPLLRVETYSKSTSYQAAATRIDRSLIEAEKGLLVIPGVCLTGKLEKRLTCAGNAVTLKIYRNLL